jgi:hypothetical protein
MPLPARDFHEQTNIPEALAISRPSRVSAKPACYFFFCNRLSKSFT